MKFIIALYNSETETTKYLYVNPMLTSQTSAIFNPLNAATSDYLESAAALAKNLINTMIGEFKVDMAFPCQLNGF